VTIHDSILRLWNTDDGRNIMRSPISLFKNREPRRIFTMQEPGLVLCFCESKEILIINVYTMSLVETIENDFEGIQICRFNNQTISLIDKKARIYTWENKNSRPSMKNNRKKLR
jgi:hypothetical protein